MQNASLKVVIPMGGLGTRLRPHTWSKPKQLISVAGKAVIDHVMDSLASAPEAQNLEVICIIGYMGEQIEDYFNEHYPGLKKRFVIQEDPLGQSHAIKLAEQYLEGPMIMVFGDTLIRTDLSFLTQEKAEAIAWVQRVPDPRRFGVAVLGEGGFVTRLIEKPQDIANDLALVGFYYFDEARDLLLAIDEQIRRNAQLKGEYYLADAINIMLERNLKMRTHLVDAWLDAGTPEALLETNRYLLENGADNSKLANQREDIVIFPPVFVHPTAQVSGSIIGPNVSLGAHCHVIHSIIQNSILEDEARADGVILEGSLVGRRASLQRRAAIVNAGDNTDVRL
jgi:glucose-1-phosphate thymidylyltransferase